jgi:citronellol/citronellal dehydrogenase
LPVVTVPSRPDVLAVLAPGSLEGRTALVTGGGSGIGRASALLLARLGARVCVVGRTQDKLDETVALAAEAGSPAMSTAVCDVREPEQVDAMLDTVLADLGQIDILLNNAGGQFVSPAELVSYKGFRAVARLNLEATWYLTARVAERSMLPAGYGKIISITMSPHRGTPGMAHSSAARAAVESLTRTLAVEWGPRGVRLVAIAPGFVHTEAIAKYGIDPDVLGSIVPVPRMQAADEVAVLVGFLAGPAGDYITGTTITADGGLDVVGPGILGQ